MSSFRIQRERYLIEKSGLFDKLYYREQFDIHIDNPVEHYVIRGWKENKNPNRDFDTKYYLENNPDVPNATNKINNNIFIKIISWKI
jgi:hypothetical protein